MRRILNFASILVVVGLLASLMPLAFILTPSRSLAATIIGTGVAPNPMQGEVKPDPARPTNPPGRPSVQRPYVVPEGSSVELLCGPGCGAHWDNPSKNIKTYYALDYGIKNKDGWGVSFPVAAAAGGTITKLIDTGILLGTKVQPGCPVDADSNADKTQGLGAIINHGNGWSTLYFHLSSLNIPDPPVVNKGDVTLIQRLN